MNVDVYQELDPRLPENWSQYRELLSPDRTAELIASADTRARDVVIKLMQYLYFHGDHERAADLAKQARADWNGRLDTANPQTLLAAGYLGLFLWALGQYPEAAEINQNVLELRRERFAGTEDAILAELRVAVDLRTQGKFTAARNLNERLHEAAREHFDVNDPITLQTAHDLAAVTRLCGDYGRALALDEDTLTRRRSKLGEHSPDTLNSMSGVWMDRRELGDYSSALEGHHAVVAAVQENLELPEDAPDLLRRLAYLAVATRKAGDYSGALDLSSQTLATYRERYHAAHPNLLACALGHAIDLRYNNRLDEAVALAKETVEQYRTGLGADHPLTLSATVSGAALQRIAGDASGARQEHDRTREKLSEQLGADHPHVIASEINLASDLAALGQLDEAVAAGTAALDKAEQALGQDHPVTLAARFNLALDRRADGPMADAVAGFRRALGEDHPETESVAAGNRANCDVDPLPL